MSILDINVSSNDNIFYSEDKEFIIRITKTKKFYTLSQYGQYNCTIEFLNSLKIPVLSINCTEKELLQTVQKLNELNANIIMGETNDEKSTTIIFESTGTFDSYIMTLTTLNLTTYPDYPVEHDLKLELYVYINHRGTRENKLKIVLPMTIQYLEYFIYKIYEVLQDIPYLDEMNNSLISDFMKGII